MKCYMAERELQLGRACSSCSSSDRSLGCYCCHSYVSCS